jgi:uracil-DNA glycosylase
VVILGQDPYHEPHQAHGLAFSVQRGVDIPPSLQNIYKELHAEVGFEIPHHGYLIDWAKQGVFLLNTVLTVREHAANSHKGKGWETFTDTLIRHLSDREEPIVFLLWGANARSKAALIDRTKHLVLQSVHPSPLSAYNGFFGCNHFVQANAFLAEHGVEPIHWQLPLD